jgi:protein-S-isoprenylcysteine O-methyltransferase Ste14
MREKNGEHPLGDAGQIILLAAFLVIWAGDSFFLRKSTFLSSYISLYIRLIISILLFIVAICLFGFSHFVVAGGSRSGKMIAGGVFRYIRHPLYLASILACFGLVVSTLSLFAFVLFIVIFIFYDFIARYEERLLEAKFGEEYKEYKGKTGKWIPKVG